MTPCSGECGKETGDRAIWFALAAGNATGFCCSKECALAFVGKAIDRAVTKRAARADAIKARQEESARAKAEVEERAKNLPPAMLDRAHKAFD